MQMDTTVLSICGFYCVVLCPGQPLHLMLCFTATVVQCLLATLEPDQAIIDAAEERLKELAATQGKIQRQRQSHG